MSDGPMHRKLFVEMEPVEQTAFITSLQARRLQAVQQYEELQRAKAEAKDQRVRAMLTQQCRIMDKDLVTVDRALSRIEDRFTKINAMWAMLTQGG